MVRSLCTGICFVAALSACTTTPDPISVPVPVYEEVKVDCTADFPDWVFEPVDVPWMPLVRELGGDNRALVSAFNVQRFLLESVNVRLEKMQELQHAAIERCRTDRP